MRICAYLAFISFLSACSDGGICEDVAFRMTFTNTTNERLNIGYVVSGCLLEPNHNSASANFEIDGGETNEIDAKTNFNDPQLLLIVLNDLQEFGLGPELNKNVLDGDHLFIEISKEGDEYFMEFL